MSAPDDAGASRRALAALVSEAKVHLDVRRPGAPKQEDALGDVEWSRLESQVMAAVEEERPSFVGDAGHARSGSRASSRDLALRAGAVVVAAAAAIALFVRKDRDVALDAPSSSEPALGASASALRTREGSGAVHVGGVLATPGYVVRPSDVIEVESARAVFERPRKVTWLLEQDAAREGEAAAPGPAARVRVKSAGESLVLGLEHGVIEAQVVPVASGEAFAVDVATARGLVRVAVHGTHLRVARSGDRVVVDLTEGVVSIGVPPRAGATYGTMVTAPAHVELDATDLATLRIDHAPEAVRAPVPLGTHEGSSAAARSESAPARAPAGPTGSVPAGPPSKSAKADGPAAASRAEVSKIALPPREAIAAAVRACAASRSRSGDVHVTVNSSLRLRVSPSGVVESAQFSPPLLPQVQSCAAEAIYKTKLAESGLVTIPIEFSY